MARRTAGLSCPLLRWVGCWWLNSISFEKLTMKRRHCQTWYATKVDSTAVGESPSLRTKGQRGGMKLAAETRMEKEEWRMTPEMFETKSTVYIDDRAELGYKKPGVRTVRGREKSSGRSRDSSVSVVTRTRAELPRNDWIFLLRKASRLALGTAQPLLQIRKWHQIHPFECNLVPEKLRRRTYVSASSYTENMPYVRIHFTETRLAFSCQSFS